MCITSCIGWADERSKGGPRTPSGSPRDTLNLRVVNPVRKTVTLGMSIPVEEGPGLHETPSVRWTCYTPPSYLLIYHCAWAAWLSARG